MEITEPLILSVGAHRPGSGRGCAMEALSWTMGDERATDYPDTADPSLARLVQTFNDEIGRIYGRYVVVTTTTADSVGENHKVSEYELLPEHAMIALDLAFLTVGTRLDSIVKRGGLGSTWTDNIWQRPEMADVKALLSTGDWNSGIAVQKLLEMGWVEEAAQVVRSTIAEFRVAYQLTDSLAIPSAAQVDAALVKMHTVTV